MGLLTLAFFVEGEGEPRATPIREKRRKGDDPVTVSC